MIAIGNGTASRETEYFIKRLKFDRKLQVFMVSEDGASIYSASKHAVIGLTKSAAVEYAKKGLRVNAVCPAVIDTEMFRRATAGDPNKAEYVKNLHPVGRIGQAEEVAAAVLYLCSPGAGFTTGVTLPVDGGSTAI